MARSIVINKPNLMRSLNWLKYYYERQTQGHADNIYIFMFVNCVTASFLKLKLLFPELYTLACFMINSFQN
jgi:hypothetical protein